MLSVSVYQSTSEKIDLTGLTDPNCKEIEGLPNSKSILGFCDAFMSQDESALAAARKLLVSEMGEAAMVDVAGIASNFQRMNRIADAIGIPAESTGNEKADAMKATLDEQLGTNKYLSATNTPK